MLKKCYGDRQKWVLSVFNPIFDWLILKQTIYITSIIKKNHMSSNLIRFGLALLLFVAGIFYVNRPKSKPQATITETKSPDQQLHDLRVEMSFKRFEEWLHPMELPKKKSCYITILKHVYTELSANKDDKSDSNDFLDFKKDDFESFINGFNILPVKDKYIMAKVKTNSQSQYNVYALFDKTDSLRAFHYYLAGGGGIYRYDSLRVEDWNKDGNLELVVNRHHEISKYNREVFETAIEVFDFNSVENKFIELFDYTLSSNDWSTIDYISTTSENKLIFEQPDLIKAVERTTYAADENIKDSHAPPNDEEGYQSAIKAQNEYKNTHPADTTVIVYYQRDKVSKIYVKK
jgi:hypothetical protein